MKTKEEFESFVADLTELEMADLLEVCNQLIERNKWSEMRDEIITDNDKVGDLEATIAEKEEEIENLEEAADFKDQQIIKVLSLLENDKFDEAKLKLSQI